MKKKLFSFFAITAFLMMIIGSTYGTAKVNYRTADNKDQTQTQLHIRTPKKLYETDPQHQYAQNIDELIIADDRDQTQTQLHIRDPKKLYETDPQHQYAQNIDELIIADDRDQTQTQLHIRDPKKLYETDPQHQYA